MTANKYAQRLCWICYLFLDNSENLATLSGVASNTGETGKACSYGDSPREAVILSQPIVIDSYLNNARLE